LVVKSTPLIRDCAVKGINAKGCSNFTRGQIDNLTNFVKTYRAKGLAYIVIDEEGNRISPIIKFFSEQEVDVIIEKMDGKNGDILFFSADTKEIVYNVLGNLRLELARMLELTKKDDYSFLWVTEFPLLNKAEDKNKYSANHHPFTMPMDEDIYLLETDPLKVRAKAYDIILNGVELGGGSIRIHQKEVQEKMFNLLGFTKEEAYERFGFLLNAFKYGVPPHGGLAYGLDRIIMLMTGSDSIRDVIAFPKTKDAHCLLTDAPNVVEEKQLDELSIKLNLLKLK